MPTQFLMLPPQTARTREWGARLAAALPELDIVARFDDRPPGPGHCRRQ